jgi:hypothetical protein
VAELRERVRRLVDSLTTEEKTVLNDIVERSRVRQVQLDHITGDSRSLHTDVANFNSVMQAASQFNYLEFPSPNVIPEKGISQYAYDRTQGPACAIACAGGTAYRNYLAVVDGSEQRGQTRDRQLNGLGDVTNFLSGGEGPSSDKYYTVRNGYVDSTQEKLRDLNARLSDVSLQDKLISQLRVGVQEDTQVTDDDSGRGRVTQIYCSALSVGYSRVQAQGDSASPWEPFARVVLNATYEATLLVGLIHTIKLLRNGLLSTPDAKLPRILLTKVGGGVFANEPEWIQDAILRAARIVADYAVVPVDIRIVHYGGVEHGYQDLPVRLAQFLGVPLMQRELSKEEREKVQAKETFKLENAKVMAELLARRSEDESK